MLNIYLTFTIWFSQLPSLSMVVLFPRGCQHFMGFLSFEIISADEVQKGGGSSLTLTIPICMCCVCFYVCHVIMCTALSY